MDENRTLIGIDLSTASPALIELLIEDAVDDAIYREIARVNMNRPEILTIVMDNPSAPDEIRQHIARAMNVPVKAESEMAKVQKPAQEKSRTVLQRIQKLSVSERIHLALRGGKEMRTILLRDPNKEVALTVLDNPKITETEVELVAKSRSIADEALRKITKKREWMRNYNIVLALITNPKTPAGISLPLVSELKTRDLALLEKNRNVSEGIRSTAKKLLRARRAH